MTHAGDVAPRRRPQFSGAAGDLSVEGEEAAEVWLDFTVTPGGTGHAYAGVPFVPAPGERAIVIHQNPTDDHGAAGTRLACLPVSW